MKKFWDPDLHPRGRDGRFIEVGQLVRWLAGDLQWDKGRVRSIDKKGRATIDRKGTFPVLVNTASLEVLDDPKASLSKFLDVVPRDELSAPKKITQSVQKPMDDGRKALHKSIIDKLIGNGTTVDRPELHMVVGGAGSGKSSLIDTDRIHLPETYALIDADIAKEMIPEYQKMLAAGDPKAASFVHEESTQLGSRARSVAFDRHYNTVLSSVGSSYESLARRVRDARKQGYGPIELHVSTLDPEEAVRRAKARAAETGREVPESFIRESAATTVRNTLRGMAEGLYDNVDIYDTSVSPPALVASASGPNLTIHDPDLWQDFLERGNVGSRLPKRRKPKPRKPKTGTNSVVNLPESDLAGLPVAQSFTAAALPFMVPPEEPPTAYDPEAMVGMMVEIPLDVDPANSRWADRPDFDQVWDELKSEIDSGETDVPFLID